MRLICGGNWEGIAPQTLRHNGRIKGFVKGLALVAVGAALTGGVTWWLSREEGQGELREAIRNVDSELQKDAAHLGGLIVYGTVPNALKISKHPEQFLPSTEWETHKEVLGKRLSGALGSTRCAVRKNQ